MCECVGGGGGGVTFSSGNTCRCVCVCVCRTGVVTHTHTLGIHSRTVLSREADATRWPEGENATDSMASCDRQRQHIITS